MKYILPFFFFFNLLHSQTADLDSLFAQFDSYRYDDVKTSLIKIDESKLPRQNRTDSIRLSLYNLVNAKFNENHQTTEELFSKNLDYLIKIGLQDYLPYFLTAYAFEFGNRKDLYQKVKYYLDLSVSISKENKNLSHYLSKVNLYNAYIARDIIRAVSDESYKKEDLYEAIKIYEENSNLIATTDTNLFKSYYQIAFSKDFSDDTRFHCLKKTFDYSMSIDSLPELYHLRDLINLFRNRDTAKKELIFINENYYKSKIKFKHLSTFDFLVNQCYIEELSNNSIIEFINHCNELLENDYVFKEYEIRDVYLTTYKSGISYNNFINDKKKNKKLDDSFFNSYFNFRYEFSKRYESLNSRKWALQDLINFNQSSDTYTNSDIDLFELDKELAEVVHKIIISGEAQKIYPSEFIDMIKTRAGFVYNGWSEQEIEEDLVELFQYYKKENSYERVVLALTFYWELELSLIPMIDEKSKFKLNESRSFIASNLSKSVSPIDIGLRIRLATLNQLEDYKLVLNKFFENKEIDKDKYNILQLSLIGSIYDLSPNKSNAEVYCNFFIDNIETPGFEYSISTALNIFVFHKIKKGIVELSNFLLNQNDEYFANEIEQNKYEFQKSAGYFFKYIRSNNRALLYFLRARANNYHWVNRGFSYKDLVRDNDLLYQIFELYLNSDLTESRQTLEMYKERYQELEEFLAIAIKASPELDKNMFYRIKNLALDMERRQLFYEKKYDASEKIIDEMLELENIKSYFGKFSLWKNKIITRFASKKYSNDEMLTMLNNLYQNLNKPIDDFYIRQESIYKGNNDPALVKIKLDAFEKIIADSEIINSLSYENQINFMTKTASELFYLESDLYNSLNTRKQLERLANYKFLIDNIDIYNSRLLNLSDVETDKYFDLLNKRFSETDYEKLNVIRSQFDVFQQRIKVTSDDISSLTSINDFQQKLDTDQAYFRFSSVGFDKYIAYIVTKDNIELVKLEESKIDKLVGYYTNRIKNKLEDSYSYDVFFKPIADKLSSNINEIFIKNYGLLTNVNFEALQNPITKRFVFEDFKINYVERPESAFGMDNSISISSAFLFGNPDFTYNIEETGRVSSIRSGLNPLPFTEVEINKLNDVLTKNGISTVTTNLYESTEQALYENSKSDIIHLATHGFYIDGESTDRFNWGLLASGSKEVLQNDFKKIRREDGIIFGSEIILKNFTKAKLVVLSACETGYGTTTFFGGENLANSFLRAGAKNIISTLWPVDDEITQLFMTEFYTDLLITKNINLSLRNTKLKIKENYPEPLYWAPFVLTQNDIK